jgi:hypothetical protein
MASQQQQRIIGDAREDEVVLLYTRDRLTFRQIAEQLGCDVKNAHQAWKRGRARLHKEAQEAFGEMVGQQLATCKVLIDGLMPVVLRSDTNSAKAAEAIVRAMDHEAKLLGLYAPVRASVTVTDEMTERVKALAAELAEL